MNTSPSHPQPPTPSSRAAANELQMRNWLRLRRELTELHARLEYLKLMVTLGVSR
ncbi:MAG: hypothetical protein H7Y61_13505 [Rhizobiales bacterium]|nr:hypothetical protein [Rhizobacter sp.]